MGTTLPEAIPDNWDAFYRQQQQSNLPACLQTFYNTPLANTKQRIQDTEYVAVDIETTGLNPTQDDIVSVGFVPFDAHNIHLSQAQHILVKSERLTPDSIVVHQITHSELDNAENLSSVLPHLINSFAGKQIVVHYRNMEREFFRKASLTIMGNSWLFPVIDTFALEAEHSRQKRRWLDKLLNRRLPSMRLPNVRERYHLPAYENHNALTDALATAEVWQAQILHWDIEKASIREWWL